MISGTVVAPTSLARLRSDTAPHAVSSGRQVSFIQVLDRISSKSGLSTQQDLKSLANFEKATTVGHEFSMKELLSFQVKAARLHLRLEACAKIADAAVSSIKRFQSMR